MKPLFLILKGEWYDRILSGEKKEEYRDLTPFWEKRLRKTPTPRQVIFQHGYTRNARRMLVEIEQISVAQPKRRYTDEQADITRRCFVLRLGAVQVLQD
ncbi:MAG: ASCH domain-containing protein [Sphingobacteriales bacterium]|nr:MAG: ASCH domain-containing protein [Sphingobacteriales bacterium]